ncbi:hypothetical protein ASPZODRAFT_170077 [Penicilliopsis zonata CBS 506.65]|uniref:non-specific serine/threonine protein kinase n=1 Tax=Penicilliopsis zonata CBS 506.65 TaxID=1073090 RepID=A0A1L9S642_9EURO|nr:hypothetical protein ASPZODRAFT_170077 [Penicilliopsis zonata CBS 506.65]OJJ42593.1 hypothetical protein ASPZODRAFT_170077 [Penicilliopsis zonata CBS 506.65]
MVEAVKVEYIGWEDDFRYAEEKQRITEHIQKIAADNGFTHACVQRAEWITDRLEKYVFTRLWFNEDGDLEKGPELFEPATANTLKREFLDSANVHIECVLVHIHRGLMSSRTYAPSPSTFTEDPDRYRKNALHPVTIGDLFECGRYRIVHKLGSGSFGTVWLGRDRTENRYVSLKILSADIPPDCKELRILQEITESTVNHKGREFVLQLLDHFTICGPNGHHLCIVAPVAGDRLARKPGLPYNSLEWPRMIGLQVAEALGYLHILGIAHGGGSISYPMREYGLTWDADCYTSNILSQLLPFDDWTEGELYDVLGPPIKHPVRRLDGGPRGNNAPAYTVDPADIAALEARLHTDRILLIDFGAAFYHHERPDRIYTPAPFASPEIVFGGELTSAVDQWAFGCLLYELCADRSLVKLLFGWNNDAMKDQVAMLGKPPEALWQNWERRDKYFHPNGAPKEAQGRRLKVRPLPLKQRVRNLEKPLGERCYGTGDEAPLAPDLQSLYDLLKRILIYDARSRLSFEAVKAHPFFRAQGSTW